MKFVIVDDDAFIVELLTQVLEAEGHMVKSFESSVRALREIPVERPECVISDVIMPEMDGFELCREIRSRPDLAGIKIIMCTSKSYDFDRRRAKELGADGYIVKPIKRESLMKQINEIMSESVTVTYWGVHGTLAGKRREHHALRWKYLLHEYRDQRRAAVHLRLRLGYQAAL